VTFAQAFAVCQRAGLSNITNMVFLTPLQGRYSDVSLTCLTNLTFCANTNTNT